MAYVNIPFWKFALGLTITAIPLTFLEQTNPKWAWAYALILVLGFATVGGNVEGLATAANYFSKELQS
jgi:hypothetical protein